MKKKMFKRLASIVLCTSMILGMVGCGKGTDTTEKPNGGSVTAEKPNGGTDSQDGNNVAVTYPLDTNDTLTMWTMRLDLSTDYSDYSESPFHNGLIKKTGVNIQFSGPVAGQNDKEAYNLLLTEDKLPHIINYTESKANLVELYNDGVIYDLAPYVEKYAPDYWAFLTAPGNEAVYRSAFTADGKLLAFWSARETQRGNAYCGPMIRQDWLDECGLEVPVTLADWENVLTVFKNKYNATFGIDAAYLYQCMFASGTGAMGWGAGYYVDNNDELQVICLQPEWYEYMKVLRKWYETGLLDADSVSMDNAACRTKIANNQLGATWSAVSRLNNFVQDAEANNSPAKWVGVPYPRVSKDAPTTIIKWGDLIQSTAAFITTTCSEEELITAIKFLNYGYSEEGMIYYNFGEEGVSYYVDENGYQQWTDVVKNDPQGEFEGRIKYTGAREMPIGIQLDAKWKNPVYQNEAVDTWMENSDVAKYYYSTSSVVLSEEDKLIYNDKWNAITTYVKEMIQKFILGTESLNDIDKFYKQLDDMGIQECLKIQREAYKESSNK